jgi:hypothetical protein
MTMYRPTALAALGAALILLAGFGGSPTRGQDRAGKGHHGPNVECARACAACAFECETCFKHCATLLAEGKREHLRTMQLCNDCGTICAVAGNIVSRQGPLQVTICEGCAKACDTCGAACEKFESDEHMRACAKACRECAKACREMIKHVGHDGAGGSR